MSHTVPSQHRAVVLRSSDQHLRALLALAIAIILGLTIAVVVLATNRNHATLARPTAQSAASPSAQTGARLGHSERGAIVTQTTDRLANYPDAPPPSATTPQPSVSYYPDAPLP
jgi:hypothetical protein